MSALSGMEGDCTRRPEEVVEEEDISVKVFD
jgi:hypothetical protein